MYNNMINQIQNIFFICLLVVCYLSKAKALFCYNCSTTHREREPCAGDFVTPTLYFNSSSHFLFNCTGARTMCFVRSWSLRAKHKWIVQRGCYQVGTEDQLFQDLSVPTRAMTCKHKRLADSEYKICLCQADWCNNAPSRIVHSPFTKNRMWMYIVCVDLLIRTHA